MAFAVTCKSCQARFLLNDDLVRRKVAGRVVTVRCRQCHATIEVDASDVEPTTLPETEKPAPPVPAPDKLKAPRPAPAPPRPAKSTLMGIGAPRPAGATELVALSPGFLDVEPGAATDESPRGFPEPPPPPGVVEVLGPDDWDDISETGGETQGDAAPESLDDFAEELPPSIPPEEEMPSSTGTPSLKALTHHDEQDGSGPRADDFLANMTAAMNGGIMLGAPTIDVSHLAASAAPEQRTPAIDAADVAPPARGAKTLPLFSANDSAEQTTSRQTQTAPTTATSSPGAPPSPTPLEPRRPDGPTSAVDSPRERKYVVAPTTESTPPAAGSPRKTSGLAAPLLLALAAAAGFLIWKRNLAPPLAAEVQAEPSAQQAPLSPPPPPVAPTTETVASAAPASSATSDDEHLTFETVPTTPASQKPATGTEATPAASPSPAEKPTPAAPKEETKPEPAPEPTPPAEPAGPFDRSAAAAALTASAGQASACRKEGDPSGVASVVVTFAPSGRVTSANISGPPFAGTPTGGCIASTLRKTKVPAFEGERVTVSKTVVIQ